ncbi:hypothetical protein [Pseudomonas sp. NFX98]|uniref:hypothetical protein n=1 Tax=Pseudomonas sp. NFX98 TaxID=3399122 RepID=UPI0039FC36EF
MVNFKACLPQWLCLLALFVAPSAEAVNQEIRALFRPDSANPQRNTFINKTPVSGYCADYPGQCEDNQMFSIRLPMRFESARAMRPNDSPRNSSMFTVPAQWRVLTVRNAQTGATEQVEVRIAGFGSWYTLSDTAANLTGAVNALEGHRALWGGASWVNAAPPCQYSGVGLFHDYGYGFFWKTPVQGTCVKTASFPIPGMSYEYLDFAYELRTPNPLGMSSGLYTGDLSYRIGPGGDFDMGDVMLPTDGDLTLNFVLDVQHTLKVEIPPGGEKIQLVPAGGWQSWLQAGRRPVSLFRDQTFNISASSRFKMQMSCGPGTNGECALEDSGVNRRVELFVSVSLPNGLTDLSSQPVRRLRLRPGAENALNFKPAFYVDRAPGTLHFEVPPHSMANMLRPGEGIGGRYSGVVTVIWDSEV